MSAIRARQYRASRWARADCAIVSKIICAVAGLLLSFHPGLVWGELLITSEPQHQTVMEWGAVTWNVTASSSSTLTYQWRFNSADLIGETNAHLDLTNVNTNHSGQYTVAVTDDSDSVTSQVALLSVNVRTPCYGGYANISSPPGISFAALPLVPFDGYTVDTLFHDVVNGTTIYKLDGNGFQVNNYLFGWTLPQMNLVPGEGWFLRNPTQTNQYLTVVGFAQLGRLTNHLSAGFSCCGSMVPLLGGLSSDLQFTPPPGTRAFVFDNLVGGYDIFEMGSGGWLPSEPNLQVGQGLWVWSPGGILWTQAIDCESYVVTTPYRIVQNQIVSQTAELNFFTYNTNLSFGRVYDLDGLTPVTNDFCGQLYVSTNAAEATLQPVGAPVPVLAGNGAGYINSGAVPVIGTSGSVLLHVQLRVWERSRGSVYEMAVTNGSRTGKSAIFATTARAPLLEGAPGLPPPDANGFASFSVVPPPPFIITEISVVDADVALQFNSEAGRTYRAERTSSLAPPIAWETVPGAGQIPGTGGTVQFVDTGAAGREQQCYRILRLP